MEGNIGGIGSNNSIPDLRTNAANNGAPQVESQAVQENAAKSGQKITQQTMGQILEQLGLADTAENQQLAKALLEYNLPLNKEALRELSRLLKQLGGEGKENVDLLAFLKSKNIPLGKDLVQILKEFLGEKNLANLLSKYLQTSLTEIPEEAKALTKLLKSLVIDGEILDPQDWLMDLKKLLESKKELLHGKHPVLAEPTAGGEKETLTKVLSELKGNLETENLLKYYQIPVLIQEKLYQAQLKINQEGQNRSRDQQEGDGLVIFLQTENLGQVKIDLTVQEKNLAFRFGVEAEPVKASLERNLPRLTERLEALGYQIKEANCSLNQESPEEVYLGMEKKVIVSGFKRIDLLT